MQTGQALNLLKSALSDISKADGVANTDAFSSLREVDAKIREVRMILEGVDGLPTSLLESMKTELDFEANSRRVRLESLSGYVKSAIRFLDTGAFEKPKKVIHAPPDFSRLTTAIPGLNEEICRRWREAQKCIHIGAHLSAVILMGSILEGLLLARAQLGASLAYRSPRAPKDRGGGSIAIQDWSLSALIDVATEIGWLKIDRAKFSHALRESRNVVHPWQAVMLRADFDAATCNTSWLVLQSSVDDLIGSMAQ